MTVFWEVDEWNGVQVRARPESIFFCDVGVSFGKIYSVFGSQLVARESHHWSVTQRHQVRETGFYPGMLHCSGYQEGMDDTGVFLR